MKNILLVASDNAMTSGAFLCMLKLAEILKKEYELNVIVILPNDIGDGENELKKIGVKTIVVQSATWTFPIDSSFIIKLYQGLKIYIYNLSAIKEIRRIIRNEKIDIVHINTSWSYVGAKAAIMEKVPFVWHLRELLQEDQNRTILFGKYGYKLIGKADNIFAVSDFVAKKYKNILNREVNVVYDGIDKNIFFHNKEILKERNINILSIGLITENKGQKTLVEACKILQKKGVKNFSVNIVGKGIQSFEAELKEYIIRNQLEGHIKFCGATNNVHQYYKVADIVVMSSVAEAFGRTTVEAMMEGCLVIGADAGATPELLNNGKCGLLYEFGNSIELADRIMYVLLNKEKIRNLAKAGQQFALNNFTAKKNAKVITEHYFDMRKNKT